MIVFPSCKINLGLHVTGKRPDGYHNIETIFFPIYLNDVLDVIKKDEPIPKSGIFNTTVITTSGLVATENLQDNICVQAYKVLCTDFSEQMSSVHMHLHKTIPIGAGLGGGSADGAFTLLLLNKLFNLKLSTARLIHYGLQLGSDCPFFIVNKPCFATGRGEILEEIILNLSEYKIVIINPGIYINTTTAFSKIKPVVPTKAVKKIVAQPVASWHTELVNDFEKPVFEEYPEIKGIKSLLYRAGAVYASLSGSGSTVFGIFSKMQNPSFHFPNHYFIRTVNAQ